MRGVDHHHVDTRIDQRFGTLEALVADSRRRGHAQAALLVLGRFGIGDRLLDVLDRNQPDAAAAVVDHQQLLDPALVQQAACLVLPGAQRHGGKILRGHQFLDRLQRGSRRNARRDW